MHHLFILIALVARRATPVTVLLALFVAACGSDGATPAPPIPASASPAPPAAAAFPRTVTGADGVATSLDAPPQCIVSFSPGATEILFAIGAGTQLVAVDRYSDFPAAAADLPHLDTYLDTADPEAALAHDPDLIVTTTPGQAQRFRDLGIAALVLDIPDSIDGVYDDMTLLGEATGRDHDALALIATTRSAIDMVTDRLVDVTEGPKVFIEFENTLYTAAPHSFVGTMLERLHARNIAAGATSPFPQLTAEAVIAANPDVVLLADGNFGENLQTVAARPGWASITAVTLGRVIAIDPDVISRPGPRIADAIRQLAAALYPDRFAASR